MPSTYTTNNGIELIGTGEQSSTWGDTTNTNLSLIDAALDGQITVTLASAGTSGSPNTLPISDGAASNGRNRLVIFADGADLGADAYVQLTPDDAEKIIYVRNSLSGSRNLILFQGTYNAANDFVLAAGKDAIVKFDGGGTGAVVSAVLEDLALDAATITTISNTTLNTGTVNATTVDTTSVEVTNLKAKDGVAAGSIANSTGVVTLGSSVLTTTDINGGTIDGVTIGGASAGAGTFTTLNASSGTITGDLTVDTNTLHVDSANNRVGIGTITPAAPLEVQTATGERIRLESDGGTQTPKLSFIRDSGADYVLLNDQGVWKFNRDTTEIYKFSSDAHTWSTAATANAMTVVSGGNVGIGTTSVDALLHVSSGDVAFGPNADADELFLENNGNVGMTLGAGINGTANIYFGEKGVGSSRGAIVFDTSDESLRFSTAGLANERMRIKSNGNVGIGTTNPTEVLHVVGNQILEGSTPSVKKNNTSGGIVLTGGTNTTTGANLVLYGETHSTLPNTSVFEADDFIVRAVDGGSISLRITGLPTSSAGLITGEVWNDGGTLKIVT